MASNTPVDFFSGDNGDRQQPVDFLKKFRRAMRESRVTTESALIKAFGDYLKTDSPAEEWYDDQNIPNTTPTWGDFETAFKTRFPGVQKARKSPADLERELSELRLDRKTLATTMAYGGQDAWSHVVFAERALDLAKRAGLEKTRSLLTRVRDELPEVFKERISGNVGTWEGFCAEIKAIDIDTLRDWVRKEEAKEKKEAEKEDANNARFTHLETLHARSTIPASPTAGIRSQMGRATITTGPLRSNVQSTHTSANPFGAGSGGRGNLFTTPNVNARNPPSEAQKASLLSRITAFPMQPNTPAGIDNYRDQCRSWLSTFGANQKINEHTGFPLQPGGTPPGSGECYVCGKTGHTRTNCTNEHVPFKERVWRNICGNILGHGKTPPAPINFVLPSQDDFTWMNSAGFEDNIQQGNGEGLSA
jgi:hypothetical protein